MNDFQLTCFLTVAELLSFARSAERLNITQPAVTHQIRSLEKELDVTLFNRTTHSVELTRAGQQLLPDALDMVNASNRIRNRFENMEMNDYTEIRFACHADGYLQKLPIVYRQFADIYPDVHINLQLVPVQTVLYRFLEEEKSDLVLGIKEADSRQKPSGIYQELTKTPIVALCAKDHPLARLSAASKADLDKTELIVFEPTKPTFFMMQMQGKYSGGRDPRELYVCSSTPAAIMLAKAGRGVFLMPRAFVGEEADLAAVPLAEEVPVSVGVYYRSLKGNEILRTFVELLCQAYR